MSPIHTLKIKPLHLNFQPPKQATDGSGGFDLYMPEAGQVPAGSQVQVGLGFASAIPVGHIALLMPRSGVGTQQTLELANTLGLIDTDYRGQWLATMRTKNGEAFSWEAGARLLQLAIVPIPQVRLEIVEELDETERGGGGHGSTGT